MNKRNKISEQLSEHILTISRSSMEVLNSNKQPEAEINKNIIHSALKNYFTVGYYTGIIPFRPVFSVKENTWKLKSGRFQKVTSLNTFAFSYFYSKSTSINKFALLFKGDLCPDLVVLHVCSDF